MPYSATDPVYIGPASNESWIIESIKLELQTSANAGNRNVYFYVRDRYGALSRYLVDSTVASSILYHIMGPNLAVRRLRDGQRAHVHRAVLHRTPRLPLPESERS